MVGTIYSRAATADSGVCGPRGFRCGGRGSRPSGRGRLGATRLCQATAQHLSVECWYQRRYLGDVLTAEVPPALDAHPHWVSIWPGINDLRAGVTLPAFTQQLDELLAHWSQGATEVAGQSKPLVIVLNIPDLRPVPAFRGVDPAVLDTTVRQWNQAIALTAQKHGARLVDLHGHGQDLLAHPGYLSGDGFHPSSAGYARIAEFVIDVVWRHMLRRMFNRPAGTRMATS